MLPIRVIRVVRGQITLPLERTRDCQDFADADEGASLRNFRAALLKNADLAGRHHQRFRKAGAWSGTLDSSRNPRT